MIVRVVSVIDGIVMVSWVCCRHGGISVGVRGCGAEEVGKVLCALRDAGLGVTWMVGVG